MIAKQLISEDIFPLSLSNTANEALSRMIEYKVSHFPVVENGKFIGVISEQNIYNHTNLDKELREELIYFENYYVSEQQYIFDILKLTEGNKLSLVPVVDGKGLYIGCISIGNILSFFAKSMSVNSPGGVIVLEVSSNDYSLTEIANIVESNDAKVLSTYVVSETNSTKLDVIIKVSKLDLGSLLQTFERYGYKINASYGEEFDYDNIKDNYDSLINYLNV